jgi:hypothetical protein
MQLLGNGNVFVGWGEVPHVSEFDYAGRMLFDAVLGAKYQSYRAFRLPWTGLPAEAPAIAATRAGRETTVYASWNGATDVHSWQLLAGTQANAMRPVWSTRSRGFESELRAAASAGPYLAVQALDTGGSLLGQSNLITAQEAM